MQLDMTDNAIQWFKKELELPQEGKTLHFFVRYGGEFQLKQGFSPAFNIENISDIDEIGYEETLDGLKLMIAEKDLWYFEDHRLKIDVQNDEVIYEAEEN
ncbi:MULTISPECIES: HesB/YadR/YfhF family protein [Staphylococcus]|uniref:HesB/YadR/YfhF family protein n=1 Tax=Staphylococcus TaxID=1279 RepID=UPI000D03B5DE|nr:MULTISPECIES: hypothetical protein [Staphylococcus]MCE4969836.1 hypothetical protein [Staphylococcus chromogenes]MDT0671078.1 hypothetical protein [Staphylococcus chromogenes]MDT0673270.1 hypothetical protein [Staphylococcus chromogenes]MDT0679903.1 hypothetical protein [Staphylococcus chromogenes]MDT0714801.1 hypothetical protein [Staphylococcus chromogenes]